MNDIVRAVLIMSLTGSILALLLFTLKPLVRHRLPKSTQYYLWLVVITALLVPVSRLIALPVPQAAPMPPTITETVTRFVITQAEETVRLQNIAHPVGTAEYIHERQVAQSPIAFVITYFVYAYPFGVLILGLYYVISYMIFVGLYRRRNIPVGPGAMALLADMCRGRRPPRMYYNRLAETPMLFGIFRPAIILPHREYDTGQLVAILSHELTHLRRKDVLIKWLTLIVTALHWFNPIVWLVSREIDRACELSCDEAVVNGLNAQGKQLYGNTLISVAAHPKTLRAITSATMSEDKKNLKVRLSAIMISRRPSRVVLVLSVLLFVAALGITVTLSACSGNDSDASLTPNEATDDGYENYNPYEPEINYSETEDATIAHVNLQIADVDDALLVLGSFASYHMIDFRDVYIAQWGRDLDWLSFNMPVAIWADAPLQDFQVIGLYLYHHDDGAITATMTHTYYSIELLDTPLIMEWFFTAGLFPNNGISFIDPSGTRRFFAIRAAYGHEDNVHELIEFEDGGVLFPLWDDGAEGAGEEAASENDTLPVVAGPVDIQHLLGRDTQFVPLDSIRHLLGNQVGIDEMMPSTVIFENGLRVEVHDFVHSFLIIYELADDRTAFHFNGINGTSTADDVVAMFGDDPHFRETQPYSNIGAYSYWVFDGTRSVKFFFDENSIVEVISFSVAFSGLDFSVLLGFDLSGEMPPVLGSQIGYDDTSMYRTYYFDTGISIGLIEDTVVSVFVEYRPDNHTAFNFFGIRGTSTYDDVVAMFGDAPYNIRSGYDEERVGATMSYGYWPWGDFGFVRFFFDAEGRVVAISFS